VLVFRDQTFSPARQVAFSRRFGALQIHVLRQFQLAGHPEVLAISNIRENGQPIGLGDAGHFWHSDLSYKAVPSLGSMLHAQELPSEGGDTLFANQHAAYDALPGRLKRELDGLRAEHSYLAKYEELRQRNPLRPKLTQAQIDEVVPAVHPVVRTHPEIGWAFAWRTLIAAELVVGSALGQGGLAWRSSTWSFNPSKKLRSAAGACSAKPRRVCGCTAHAFNQSWNRRAGSISGIRTRGVRDSGHCPRLPRPPYRTATPSLHHFGPLKIISYMP
jgi:hypothetical protein